MNIDIGKKHDTYFENNNLAVPSPTETQDSQ